MFGGFRSLAANKVRSALSMLGILIGVGAVVAMLALGRGAQKAIESQLSSLGSNLLVLRPGAVRVGGVAMDAGAVTRLTMDDITALKEKIPGILHISAGVNFSSRALGYTHGLVVRFNDRASLEAYQPHPAHQDAVANHVRPNTEGVLALDYEFR